MSVQEVAQKLKDFGLEVSVEGNEMVIPVTVTYISTVNADLQMRQGSYKISYVGDTKRLYVRDKNGKRLEIQLPKRSFNGFFRGNFWVQFLEE